MSTFKKAKVVMLPTNEKSSIINLDNEELFHIDQYVPKLNKGNTHLYIISDDEIKEGDWMIRDNEQPTKVTPNFFWDFGVRYFKIIATTDESLKIDNDITNQTSAIWDKTDVKRVIIGSKSLPKPSDSFIKKYIEEYNKGNVITDVLVEYELISNEEYFLNTINPDENVPYFDENLKINPKDNTITIRKVKDSWNREEILNDIEQAIIQGLDIGQYRDKWIKENL